MKYIFYLISISIIFLNSSLADYKPRVIVIGAGLSGLTAAYRLHQNNVNVELYEARSRVGGRVHTVLIKNLEGEYSKAELGGQEITDGGRAKNILNIAKELNLEINETQSNSTRRYYQGHNSYNYYELLYKIGLTKKQVDEKIKELRYSTKSMKEVIDNFFIEDRLKKIFYVSMTGYNGGLPERLTTYHHIDSFRDKILTDIDYKKINTSRKIKYNRKSFKNGNASLPLKLASLLGDKVHLNKILKSISYTPQNAISLLFDDGSKEECDKLILAIPASVYNDIHFDKNLIKPQQLSLIKKIEYGKGAKIFIPVQDISTDNILISDNTVDFFNDDYKLLTIYFINDEGLNSPIQSLFSREVSILKDIYKEVKLNELRPALAIEEQYTKYNSPVAKSWISDPYSKGSYSYYGVELGKEINKTIYYKGIKLKKIFKPIEDKIFFIGEHTTILNAIATMEGAVESGERIAKLINKLLKETKKPTSLHSIQRSL